MSRITIHHADAVADKIRLLLEAGALTPPTNVVDSISKKLSVLHPHGMTFALVSNGTVALEAAYRALGSKKVIVPANTFWATATAAVRAGAEVGIAGTTESGMLDPDALMCMSPSAADTVAYVPIGGWDDPAYHKVAEICAQRGWKLVEDAAHAVGSSVVGKYADAVTFSFYATKVLTCGEGGAVGFKDPKLTEAATTWSDQGKTADSPQAPVVFGTNGRLTSMQAVLLDSQLDELPLAIERRRMVIRNYANASLPGLSWYGRDGGNGYKLIARKPGLSGRSVELAVAAEGAAMDTPVYRVPLHQMSALMDLSSVHVIPGPALEVAEAWADEHFALPCWETVDSAMIERTVRAVQKFVLGAT